MDFNGTEQLILSYIFSKKLCMGILLACMSVHHMHVVPVGQRWVLDSLELESYRVVSHHRERVGSGDKCWESQVLC